MNYLSRKHDWIKFEKDNPSVALNVLNAEKEKISCPCVKACSNHVSKQNSKYEKQFIPLTILRKEM